MPGFPLVEQGIPIVESMLASKDPELMHHLYQTIKMARNQVAGFQQPCLRFTCVLLYYFSRHT